MTPSQDRQDETAPARRPPAEQAPGSRSGEGAASAMEQLISQDRQRRQQAGEHGQEH